MNGFRRLGVAVAMLGLTAAVAPVPALAWGVEGHRVIADIASMHLSDEARYEVNRLLALEGAVDLAQISNQADETRREHPETAPWHFVNIPLGAVGYDAMRDCPRNACVVAKLDYFAAVLSNPSLPDSMRLPALEFVVHFVGDIHQPLHVADNRDRGGNDVRVFWNGRPMSLHHVWDDELVQAAGNERQLAYTLNGYMTPEQVDALTAGTSADWATEAHQIAVQCAYGPLPPDGTITDAYKRQGVQAVEMQLARAGFRLADLLNRAIARYTGR